jgi:hypothetical protein
VIDQGLEFGPSGGEEGFAVKFCGQDLIFGDTWLSVTCPADILLRRAKCWVPEGLVAGPELKQETIMIQSQGTFIFVAATVAVLVTVATVVILQVRSRKRGPK